MSTNIANGIVTDIPIHLMQISCAGLHDMRFVFHLADKRQSLAIRTIQGQKPKSLAIRTIKGQKSKRPAIRTIKGQKSKRSVTKTM